eukprot:55928_1
MMNPFYFFKKYSSPFDTPTLFITNRSKDENRSCLEDVHFHDNNNYIWPSDDSYLSWCYGSNDTNTILKIPNFIHKFKHLIIFDFDDTLFFTSFLYHEFNFNKTKLNNPYNFNKEVITIINNIGELLCNLFKKLIKYYGSNSIKIITSAQSDWPVMCMTNYGKIISNGYRNFLKLLNEYNIEIISARNLYSQKPKTNHITTIAKNINTFKYIDDSDDDEMIDESEESDNEYNISENDLYDDNDSEQWKMYTFDLLIKKHFTNNIDQNIMYCIQNIGDSFAEYNAVRMATNYIDIGQSYRYLLRIKLLNDPNIYEFYEALINIDKIMNDKINMFKKINGKNYKSDTFPFLYMFFDWNIYRLDKTTIPTFILFVMCAIMVLFLMLKWFYSFWISEPTSVSL